MTTNSKRALFLGSKELGLQSVQAMVAAIPGHVAGAVTFDDSSDSRSALTEISAYCKSVDLPLSVISRPGDLESIVREQSPQYVLVSGWYWIIKPALLSSVPGGFVGLHPSLLPKYRGSAPLVWALLNGEKQTGVSLFYFDDGMDTGDIIDQRSFAIEPEDSIAELLAKAESANLDLVKTYAGSLLSNTAPRRRQDHKLASYGSPRRPEDGRICWNQSATEVYNFIRAQTRPYPCAFTHSADGRILRISRASIFPHPYYGVPGLVGHKQRDGVVTACGDGAVVIHEWGFDDSPAVPPNGGLKYGTRLGGISPIAGS